MFLNEVHISVELLFKIIVPDPIVFIGDCKRGTNRNLQEPVKPLPADTNRIIGLVLSGRVASFAGLFATSNP